MKNILGRKVLAVLAISILFTLSFITIINNEAEAREVSRTVTNTFTTATALEATIEGKTLVCFGDSIMKGSTDIGFTTPIRINNTFKRFGLTLNVVDGSQGGDEIDVALGRIQNDVHNHTPDYVFIMLGTNNVRNAAPNYRNLSRMLTNYTEILDSIIANNSGVEIYIASIHNMGGGVIVPGSWTNLTIFNTAVEAMALNYSLNFIDIYDIFFNAGNMSLISDDNLHPDDAGYKLIADTFAIALISDYQTAGITTGAGLNYNSTGLIAPMRVSGRYDALIDFSDEVSNNWDWTPAGIGYFLSGVTNNSGNGSVIWANDTYLNDDLTVHYTKDADGGIVSVYIDTVLRGSFDTYNATEEKNESTAFTVNWSANCKRDLKFVITDNNSASSGWVLHFEGYQTNYSINRGIATSKSQDSPLAGGTRLELNVEIATKEEVKRLISPVDPEMENEFGTTPQNYTDYVSRTYHSISGFSDSHSYPLYYANDTYKVWGMGNATLHFIVTPTVVQTRIMVDNVSVYFDNIESIGTQVEINFTVTVDLGSFGYHEVKIIKHTAGGHFDSSGMEYITYNYLYFTSTDGTSWTYRNDTSQVNENTDNIYYRLVFYGDPTLNSTSITYYADFSDQIIQPLISDIPPIISLTLLAVLLIAIAMVISTIIGAVSGGKRR